MLCLRFHGLEGEDLKTLRLSSSFVYHINYAPQHILSALQLLKDQTSQVKAIIIPVVERGAYHAHSESILLSLLSSELKDNRSFALWIGLHN